VVKRLHFKHKPIANKKIKPNQVPHFITKNTLSIFSSQSVKMPMIISLTGIIFYELEHSLDNFNVAVHENKEAAVEFIYEQAKKYLQSCKCQCKTQTKCTNCPKKQLVQLRNKMRIFHKCVNYDQNEGYCCDFSEFHHKMIITS
jgi:hypothetical protein